MFRKFPDPVLLLAFVAGAIQVISAFAFHLTGGQQGLLDGLAVAVVGLVTAAVVAHNGLAPALLGFIQAGLAVAVGFGAHLTADQVSILTGFAAAAVAMFVRTQVTTHYTLARRAALRAGVAL